MPTRSTRQSAGPQVSSNPAPVRAARGSERTCKGWIQEAALRMLCNNLDPEVAEIPQELIVYGGSGKAARNWDCFHRIVSSLKQLENDETLLVQSGKPVGIFKTQPAAPRVLIANSNLVGQWANWEEFRRLDALGLMMYGQMTAGSWTGASAARTAARPSGGGGRRPEAPRETAPRGPPSREGTTRVPRARRSRRSPGLPRSASPSDPSTPPALRSGPHGR